VEFEKVLKCFEAIPFFEGFTREERRFLASLDCNRLSFTDGEAIIREGDLARSVYILVEGRARVTRNKPPEVTLSRLDTGAVFGEIALLGKRPRTTSVAADGPATVLMMDGETIERLNPVLLNKFKNKLIELLANRLDALNEQLMNLVR